MNLTDRLREFLLRQKPKADSLLFLLSLLALSVFASNEIMAIHPGIIPLDSAQWTAIQLTSRVGIWICFIAYLGLYGLVSEKPWNFVRDHLVEILICVAWFPQQSHVSLLHDLTNLMSLDTVQLVGTLANGFLVVRHVVRNLGKHPIIVTGSAYLFVIITASELLVKVEPQTFHTLFDAVWYSMATTTTVGYGDIVPHSYLGRCIGMGLMVSGISLAGALIGIVSQLMQRRLGQQDDKKETNELRAKLELEQNKNERLLQALEKDNELKAQVAEALSKLPRG